MPIMPTPLNSVNTTSHRSQLTEIISPTHPVLPTGVARRGTTHTQWRTLLALSLPVVVDAGLRVVERLDRAVVRHYGVANVDVLEVKDSHLAVDGGQRLDAVEVARRTRARTRTSALSFTRESSRWWPCGSTIDATTLPPTSWKKTKSGCIDRQLPIASRYATPSESAACRGGLRYQPRTPSRASSALHDLVAPTRSGN